MAKDRGFCPVLLFIIAFAMLPNVATKVGTAATCVALYQIITIMFPFLLLCLYVVRHSHVHTVGIDKDQPHNCSNHTRIIYTQLAIPYNCYNNFFPILYLGSTGVSHQCYTNADCTGELVAATNLRHCCASTSDGLSYSDGSGCTVCRGMSFILQGTNNSNSERHCLIKLLLIKLKLIVKLQLLPAYS